MIEKWPVSFFNFECKLQLILESLSTTTAPLIISSSLQSSFSRIRRRISRGSCATVSQVEGTRVRNELGNRSGGIDWEGADVGEKVVCREHWACFEKERKREEGNLREGQERR